jgi:hypothetical protein
MARPRRPDAETAVSASLDRLRADGVASMKAKKIFQVAVVVLLLFYLVTQPVEAAEGARTLLGWLKEGAVAIITFLESLFV